MDTTAPIFGNPTPLQDGDLFVLPIYDSQQATAPLMTITFRARRHPGGWALQLDQVDAEMFPGGPISYSGRAAQAMPPGVQTYGAAARFATEAASAVCGVVLSTYRDLLSKSSAGDA